MTDNRQSLSDLASLTQTPAPATTGGAPAAAEGDAPAAAPQPPVSTMPLREQIIDKQGRAYATGRRKDAVARVWLKPGTGKITINGRDQEVYFARPTLRLVLNQVFGVTEREGQYDVVCTVKGGGLSGQAGAVKHGISQAITRYEPALRAPVKAAGFLTRDSRIGRAQEVRPRQGSQQLPVLEALIASITVVRKGRSGDGSPFFVMAAVGQRNGASNVAVPTSPDDE